MVTLAVMAGVAFATPVPVLRIDPGGLDLSLGDGGRYEYVYQQSIYQVPVIEEHEYAGDAIRIVRVRSIDRRAVEYFRWGDDIRREGDVYVQDAPPNRTPALAIRITREGAQHLRSGDRDIDLRDHFGERLVTVTGTKAARGLALLPWSRP